MRQGRAPYQPIATLRPRDAIYRALKRRILLNELEPETLLTELRIAEDMRCSQGTVREALLRLQEDGLVLRSGHRGTSVTPLDAIVAGEVIALRRHIETRAALHSGGALSPECRADLGTQLGEMEQAAAEGDEFRLIEADIAFHMILFRAARFRALEPILHRLMLHTHRQKLWKPRHRRSMSDIADRHGIIMDSLTRGGVALADALGAHIDTIVDTTPPTSPLSPRIRVLS